MMLDSLKCYFQSQIGISIAENSRLAAFYADI